MKSIRFIITVSMVLLMVTGIIAQTHAHLQTPKTKTATIKVMGNCEVCKARIEKAAKVNGVSRADWNVNSKILTLVYNPSVISAEDVQKKIAEAGHDTEKYKADDKVYNSLPGCCKYR